MLPRHPMPATTTRRRVPPCWLMTDARHGARLLPIIAAMPPRSAIVVRPAALPAIGRAAVLRAIRRGARARRHLLLIAEARSTCGYDGHHDHGGRSGAQRGAGFRSVAVHDAREAAAARRAGVDAMLVSPVFATRSHPGCAMLGVAGFARLAAQGGRPAVALGGMTAQRYRATRRHGAAGWAAIDGWML